jgi:DNA-binding transcriptional ArsR family regulator
MKGSLDGGRRFGHSGTMEIPNAVAALGALAHAGRLEVFRRLVQAGPEGLAAGEIARATGSLPNTLSTNLNILAGAGLVASRREGRSIIYTAGYERMRELLAFLVEDCCAGKPEICAPLAAAVSAGCAAEGASC